MTPGQRIKKARIAAGLSQQVLADAISQFGDGKAISRTAIAQWESGATKEIEAANLLKAAKILNVSPEWLQFGFTDTHPVFDDAKNLLLIRADIRTIPLLSQTQAEKYMEFIKKSFSNVGVDQALAQVISRNTFALVIKRESMAPILKPGDIIIVDPDIKPQPGEIVVAKLDNQESVVVKKYRPLGIDEAGFETFELIPANEDWPKILVNSKNRGRIIGTLVEHRCRRRIPQLESLEFEPANSP